MRCTKCADESWVFRLCARISNQLANRRPGRIEKEKRIVTCGRRFVCFASGDAKEAACSSRRREFESSAAVPRRQEPFGGPSIIAIRGSRLARSRPIAARSAGVAKRSALRATTRAGQSKATAWKLYTVSARSLPPNKPGNRAGTALNSSPSSERQRGDRLQFGAETAWRERPRSVAAGVIGTPGRSRGRSRHGTCFERAPEHACRTEAAKNAALADHRQLAAPVEVVTALCDVSSRSH